jgi:amino acid adenylation domain-containing protein
MVQDAGLKLVLTSERQRALVDQWEVPVLSVDGSWDETEAAVEKVTAVPENLAYVLYTSGSTGRPKGVGMTNQALVNILKWHVSKLDKGKRFLQFASLGFDVSFNEIFAAWCAGGTVVMLPEELRMNPPALVNFIAANSIDKVMLAVTILDQMANHCIAVDDDGLRSLKEIIVTGEQLLITRPVIELFKRLKVPLHNHYGPTEAHVVSSYTLRSEPETWPMLPPIGRPISNVRLYVLDADLNPAPAGVTGDLYISGVALARGYQNRPELTAEKFIPDPHANATGARMYKTGDLARYLADGEIEFLGRRDHQVKIRGIRIELAEIESALNSHPDVRECVVVAREVGPLGKQLVAYVVPDSDELTVNDLHGHIHQRLPRYMVPSIFVQLDEIPLTRNQKVDRAALPEPTSELALFKEEFIAPRNVTEGLLEDIWAGLLDVERISVRDSFFDLGGHSLLAVQVTARVNYVFQTEFSLSAFFADPTIEGMARVLAKLWGGEDVVEEVARTFRELEDLGDEELKQILSGH